MLLLSEALFAGDYGAGLGLDNGVEGDDSFESGVYAVLGFKDEFLGLQGTNQLIQSASLDQQKGEGMDKWKWKITVATEHCPPHKGASSA